MRNYNNSEPSPTYSHETGTPLDNGVELDLGHDKRYRGENVVDISEWNRRGMGGAALPRYERPLNPAEVGVEKVAGVSLSTVRLRHGYGEYIQGFDVERPAA